MGNRGSGSPTFLEYGPRDLPKNDIKFFEKSIPRIRKNFEGRCPNQGGVPRPPTTRVVVASLVLSGCKSLFPLDSLLMNDELVQ